MWGCVGRGVIRNGAPLIRPPSFLFHETSPLTNGRRQDVSAKENERVLLGKTPEGCLESRSPGLGFGRLLLHVINIVKVEDRDGRSTESVVDGRGFPVSGGSCGLRRHHDCCCVRRGVLGGCWSALRIYKMVCQLY